MKNTWRDVQKWSTKVMSKREVQKWHPKVMSGVKSESRHGEASGGGSSFAQQGGWIVWQNLAICVTRTTCRAISTNLPSGWFYQDHRWFLIHKYVVLIKLLLRLSIYRIRARATLGGQSLLLQISLRKKYVEWRKKAKISVWITPCQTYFWTPEKNCKNIRN